MPGLQSWLHGAVLGVQVMALASRARARRLTRMAATFIFVNGYFGGCVRELVGLVYRGPDLCKYVGTGLYFIPNVQAVIRIRGLPVPGDKSPATDTPGQSHHVSMVAILMCLCISPIDQAQHFDMSRFYGLPTSFPQANCTRLRALFRLVSAWPPYHCSVTLLGAGKGVRGNLERGKVQEAGEYLKRGKAKRRMNACRNLAW